MSRKKRASKAKATTAINVGDPEDREGRLKAVGGSQFDSWNNILANQLIQTLWVKHSDDAARSTQFQAAICGLVGIEPKDELEGMMAAQMIAAHSAAMECYRRAMLAEQTFEGRRENLNQANKLSRTQATLLDALNKHRGKGQQKVRVEHVQVHAGGQAVVGAVEAPGGGEFRRNADQPHAKQIAHAPEPTMRGPDPEREPMPVAGDEKRPLPDARRHVTGCAEG